MTARDFCYWLQGFFEINKAGQPLPSGMTPVEVEGLTAMQYVEIERHLSMVFLHEIDKTHGDAKEQAALNAVHNGPDKNKIARC